ncbi:SGNH/GDSL hydrolase family protein [Streptomyces jumonjinensis]|uniref:SGNH/GDSL hydrolase family protein n=1 Tax=Streptomyces jumonjinensis TaxID=1945 RepID=UPI0037B3C1A8
MRARTGRVRTAVVSLAVALAMAPAPASAGGGDTAGAGEAAGAGAGAGDADRDRDRDEDRGHTGWTSAWGSALHSAVPPPPWAGPNWSMEGFSDQSLRQTVRVTAAGTNLRVRLSNRYGRQPLQIARATVAKTAEGAAVRAGTLRELRFAGRAGTVVPTGAERLSDAAALTVRPLEKLTLTLYFAAGTGPATFHLEGFATSYRASGDRAGDASGAAFGQETTQSLYFLSGVEVAGARTEGSVVAFGDSITDGYASTPGADRRYPDRLSERLLADGRRLGVVNAGISGNMLLTDSRCFGEKGLTRFRPEVLDRAGVRTAVVLIGINDIGGGGLPDVSCAVRPVVGAEQIIAGHRELIRSVRQRGVTVVGATMTPFKNYQPYYTPEKEEVRDAVNHWIRTSGAYDAVVDLDRALADPRPGHGDELAPAYDFGDGIHPNDAGMKALAEAVADRLPESEL